MMATRNNLRAATAALSGAAIILLAAILLTIRPVLAFAEGDQAQGAAEGNIMLSVPEDLSCAVKADGSILTPEPECYAIKNEGSVAVVIAAPTVQLTNEAGVVNVSAQAAVIDTVDNNLFEDKLNSAGTVKFAWIEGNKGQSEQTLESGYSLCAKFAIASLTREKNAMALDQATTSSGFHLATVNYAFKMKEPKAYAVFFDNGRTEMLYKGYDRPVKDAPYRGSSEPVFDYVEDVENKTAVFQPYKAVIEKAVIEDNIKPSISKEWFLDCTKLRSIEKINNLDTSGVTDMSYMFNGCWSLASLDVSRFDTSSVKNMSKMFNGCNSLASLDLSSFDTSSVTDSREMFDLCKLVSVTLTGNRWTQPCVNQLESFGLASEKEISGKKVQLTWDSVKNLSEPVIFTKQNQRSVPNQVKKDSTSLDSKVTESSEAACSTGFTTTANSTVSTTTEKTPSGPEDAMPLDPNADANQGSSASADDEGVDKPKAIVSSNNSRTLIREKPQQ